MVKFFQIILANLIRSGKVIVETPNLDIDELRKAVRSEAEAMLQEIEGIVFEEEMADAEKVEWSQNRLEEGTIFCP